MSFIRLRFSGGKKVDYLFVDSHKIVAFHLNPDSSISSAVYVSGCEKPFSILETPTEIQKIIEKAIS